MRKAAVTGQSLALGWWVALSACLPERELSSYSQSVPASAAPALEPAVAPGEPAGGATPAPGGPGDAAGAPAAPSDTPANTDGPAQPEQLAPAPPADAPAGAEPPAAPPAAPVATPPSQAPAPAPDAQAEPPSAAAPVPPVGADASAAGAFRFVRLVADSGFNGGALSAAAELEVFGAEGQVLARAGWVATADSAEPAFFGGQPASLAIDGSPASAWHTPWFQLPAPPPHPHFLQLDMLQAQSVSGFRYLARQDASVGRIADYRFYVSADGVEWGEPILTGRLQDSALPQDVRLPAP